MLKKAGLPGRKAFLRQHPHGLRLADNRPGTFLGTDRVLTPDGRVDLAPAAYRDDFRDRLDTDYDQELRQADRFKLIGKREVRRVNTSSANVARLVRDRTNYCYIHPDDAREIGVADGDRVDVSSAFGRITIPVRLSDEMMRRTVAIPQCWGHEKADGLGHAQRHPGVNSNLLAGDGPENVERLSGMSHLSGIPVDLSPHPA